MPITFAVAVNDRSVFRSSLIASPCLSPSCGHELLVQEGFVSAAAAYNDAITRSSNDLIVFAHQDVIFPRAWERQLNRAIDQLRVVDPNWGVLGCWGATIERPGIGHIYSNGLGILGEPFDTPIAVQTLDEVVLVLRKSSQLTFDERVPNFHFYGAAVCLTAAERGMKSYVIPAFCIHNTQYNLVLPNEFYESYDTIRQLWRHSLPIQTSCIKVTRFGLDRLKRRTREYYLKYRRRKTVGARRVTDIAALISRLDLLP